MSVKEIIDRLKATRSHILKEKILEANVENIELKAAFQLTFSEDINFYTTSKQLPAIVASQEAGTLRLETAFKILMAVIATRHITGAAAKQEIVATAALLSDDDREIFLNVLDRDLDCGVGPDKLNKIFGADFIYVHPVMLASKDEPKARDKIKFPCFYQVKYDAMRIEVLKEAQRAPNYTSRNGRTIQINNARNDSVINRLDELYGESMMYDGEVFFLKPGASVEDRETSNGVGNKAIHGTISDAEKDMVHIVLWDAVPLSAFRKRYYGPPYNIRFTKLQEKVKQLGEQAVVSTAESYIIRDWNEAKILYKEFVNRGLEGGMVKNLSMPWEDDRVDGMVKMKEVIEGDFKIIDIYEGEPGRREGKIGGFVISSLEDGGNEVTSNCGSGLDDSFLLPFSTEDEIEEAKKQFVGKIAKIEYNKIVKDKKTKKRRFYLPIFKGIRYDKTVPDKL